MTCVMRPVWLAGVAMKTLSFEFLISDDRQFDGDVALGRLRVRADRVGFLNQLLELVLVGARYRNLELDAKAEAAVPLIQRSEEHTSELQSHLNLVCRLLLEKK